MEYLQRKFWENGNKFGGHDIPLENFFALIKKI